jgi:hypothetical protein
MQVPDNIIQDLLVSIDDALYYLDCYRDDCRFGTYAVEKKDIDPVVTRLHAIKFKLEEAAKSE